MRRYILRFVGQGPKPVDDVERLRAVPGLSVLDDPPGRMLLVEAPEERLRPVVKSLPQWVMAEETMVPLPDPRQKIRSALK